MIRGLIQRGDIAALLQRATGVKHRGPSPTLSDSVQPVLIVGDARDESVPHSARPALGGGTVTSGAGFDPHIALLNPSGSGVELWIDFVAISAGTSLTALIANPSSILVATGGDTGLEAFLDGRVSGKPNGQIIISSNATPSTSGFPIRVGSAGTTFVPVDALLPAGFNIDIQVVGASTLFTTFFWREVPIR